MYVGKILCFESSTYTWLIETCKNECLNVIFLKQCLLPKFVSIHSVFVVTVRGRIKEKFVLSQVLKKKAQKIESRWLDVKILPLFKYSKVQFNTESFSSFHFGRRKCLKSQKRECVWEYTLLSVIVISFQKNSINFYIYIHIVIFEFTNTTQWFARVLTM